MIDILFPDRDVSFWDTNDGSIVARLSYGKTSIMLMGDATAETEKIILSQYPKPALTSTILKVGHHGSRTSTDSSWLAAVSPRTVVISAGKDNSYGHPHPETLGRIRLQGAAILSTIDEGTITFTSDGQAVVRKTSVF